MICLQLCNYDLKKTYTLVMVDPDVPLHGDGYFFLHWLHVGLQCISGCISGECISGECISGECISGECISGECISGECISGECISGECISGECISGECISGECISGECYVPPMPPPFTGVHRYMFYLFEETGKGVDRHANIKRFQFNLYKHAKQRGLCGPVAQAMFNTQFSLFTDAFLKNILL
nr:uncharacterized protein LOC128703730 [Cherax quadricarinatus]